MDLLDELFVAKIDMTQSNYANEAELKVRFSNKQRFKISVVESFG